MIRIRRFLVLVPFICNLGCASNQIALSKVETLPLGSDVALVERQFGKPNEVQPVKDGAGSKAWIYVDSDRVPRATFVLDEASQRIIAKAWSFESTDPGHDVDTIIRRFGNNKFELQNAKWMGHYLPDEASYIDSQAGVAIDFRKTRREATAIRWFQP